MKKITFTVPDDKLIDYVNLLRGVPSYSITDVQEQFKAAPLPAPIIKALPTPVAEAKAAAPVKKTQRKLTTQEAARHLGIGVSTLHKYRLTGGGPTFLRLGRSVRYDIMDLEAWAASDKNRPLKEGRSPGRPRNDAKPVAPRSAGPGTGPGNKGWSTRKKRGPKASHNGVSRAILADKKLLQGFYVGNAELAHRTGFTTGAISHAIRKITRDGILKRSPGGLYSLQAPPAIAKSYAAKLPTSTRGKLNGQSANGSLNGGAH